MRTFRRRTQFVAPALALASLALLARCSGARAPTAGPAASGTSRTTAAGGSAAAHDGGGASASAATPADAGPYLTGEARRAHVVDVIERHQDVQGCWSDAVEREPGHPPETFRVQLRVDRDGRAQVEVNGVGDPQLERCIRVRVAGHRFGPGDEVVVEPDFTLSPGG